MSEFQLKILLLIYVHVLLPLQTEVYDNIDENIIYNVKNLYV